MKPLSMLLIFIWALFPAIGLAEIKVIISEGTYNMGDGETPTVAENRAVIAAKRIALEQAGTYVESCSTVENLKLTKDEIQVLAAGIMEVNLVDKKRTVIGDGIHFWVKIKAKVTTDKIAELAKRVKDKKLVDDYKQIKEVYDRSQKEIERLKKELAAAKDENAKRRIGEKVAEDEKIFQVNWWCEQGDKHSLNRDYDAAIEAYNRAIALHPDYAMAYFGRSIAYFWKDQFDRAIEDISRAIILNPKNARYYSHRARAYELSRQYDKAIDDYNRAIDLDPVRASSYYSDRGGSYNLKGQYDKAIEDYNRAIALIRRRVIIITTVAVYILIRGYTIKRLRTTTKQCISMSASYK